MMPLKILFITWDGPQTSYMEGLFLPIFNEIKKTRPVDFHVIQFTWATPEKTDAVKKLAAAMGITYVSHPVYRKPIAVLGNIITLFKGICFIERYIREKNIAVVMPRSTMPAVMVNRLKNKNIRILFDADGLPLEERVDFSGLSRNDKQYVFLKKEERKMLAKADVVITRSKKAIAIHLQTLKGKDSAKFSVVFNGRDIETFRPYSLGRAEFRSALGIETYSKVFVYCGSLGPQYGWEEMISIFDTFHKNNSESVFLILTGNTEFALERIPEHLKPSVLVKKVPFEMVPDYLNAADIAFAIREPKYSMQGVAPIKLGEYLLMGLPTIASAGIGDSEEIIKEIPDCFLFDHKDKNAVTGAVTFVEHLGNSNHETIREYGIRYFSMEKSAESYMPSLNKLTDICSKSPQK